MERRYPDYVDEKAAERVLDTFLRPYMDQGAVDEFIKNRSDKSLENKAAVSYHIINGDYSERLENNVAYGEEDVFSD